MGSSSGEGDEYTFSGYEEVNEDHLVIAWLLGCGQGQGEGYGGFYIG